jgi:hypothetical protein
MPICAFCFYCELRQAHSGTDDLCEKNQHFASTPDLTLKGRLPGRSRLSDFDSRGGIVQCPRGTMISAFPSDVDLSRLAGIFGISIKKLVIRCGFDARRVDPSSFPQFSLSELSTA